ncbi:MAG: DUF2784 domain-containing protein [Chitinophagaceae bacterium]
MLIFLDIFFTVAHLAFTFFNLTGWIWKRTHKAHLVTLALTLISWFVFGIWYGWGYCFLTDWHWQVKEKLGEKKLPNSFIKYFADMITGKDINPSLIDTITLSCFIIVVIASLYVNFNLPKKKKP